MPLANGYYAPDTAKKVTHWPAPDANGDGEVVWVDQYGPDGQYLGRDQAKDNNGNVVYYYQPPEGFRNVASKEAGSDGVTDNYVKIDERGRIARHPVTGAAYGIKPGTTLVEHPDGNAELLRDDFSRYLFEKAHTPVDAPASKSVAAPRTEAQKKRDEEEADRVAFEEWKKSRGGAS